MSFEEEKEAFEKLLSRLLENPKYQGRYVAVFGGQVVDSELDDGKLYRRMIKTYTGQPFFIGKVTREKEIVYLPSPLLFDKGDV